MKPLEPTTRRRIGIGEWIAVLACLYSAPPAAAETPPRVPCPGLAEDASPARHALCWFESDERGDALCKGETTDEAQAATPDGSTDETGDATSDRAAGEAPVQKAGMNRCISNAVAWCAEAALEEPQVANACSLVRTRAGLPVEAADAALPATETDAEPLPSAAAPEAEAAPEPEGATLQAEADPEGALPEPTYGSDQQPSAETLKEAGVSVPGLVLTSLGAAGIITGGVLFAMAASQSADLADAEPGTEWTRQMQDDHDRVTALRVGGGLVMQAGAILVGVGVVLLLGDGSGGDEADVSRLELSPLGKGVDLKWRF